MKSVNLIHGFSGYCSGMRTRTVYLVLMGTCVVLIALAWNVVRLWSVPAAVAMSIVAAPLPPIAVILANRDRGG